MCTNLQPPHVLELRHDCSAPSSKLIPMMPTRRTARPVVFAAATSTLSLMHRTPPHVPCEPVKCPGKKCAGHVMLTEKGA